MQRQNRKNSILSCSDGFAVVEATFVFPIMFMVFFALVLLALYLPQRAMLQRATQFAATAIATEMSDTWVYYSEETPGRYATHGALRSGKGGVYVTLFNSVFGSGPNGAKTIVENIDNAENIPMIANGDLLVECRFVNYVVYKEVIVTAKRTISTIPIGLSIIQFPNTIELEVSSTAVVQNADEFIRNVDLAVDFVDWVRKKYPAVDNIFTEVQKVGSKIGNFFGIV